MTAASFSKSISRVLTLVLLATLGLIKTGCDYNMVEVPPFTPLVRVSITPETAEMQKGTTLALSAVISRYRSNGSVTWEFAGPAAGVLQGTGLTATYTAPSILTSSPLLVLIRVRSVEDTARYATAVLTILDTLSNGGNNGNGISISVSPSFVTIEGGQTQQFTATVKGTTDPSVTWRIVTGLGVISSEGLYGAPSNIAASQVTTIEATAVADPSVKATATITVRKLIDPDLVCFERDVMPIFAKNCAVSGCHTASNSNPPADLRLDTYEQIKSETQGNRLMESITTTEAEDRMPRNRDPLSGEQIDIIRRWIAQGRKNEPCEDTGNGGCDTLNLSFAASIKPIFDAQCIGCHQGSSAPRGIDLTAYTGIRSIAQTGQLVGSITHTSPYISMPESPRPKLDDCTIAKIKAWINTGMPNN